ncbi:hypothetical protein EJB05_32471 [Eragrostis curvula]|uniref:F-box domain-containing protein n=1 Tax=Eragrostis curvula TaxID=38414 RepID=A0A5J9UG93_9POAL|nr:hypothetical protein EJB05_32471 [Eragrostis curvula]
MAHGPSPAELPPDEVIQEILLRLPPHAAFFHRASLVCKLWRRLLLDPDFIHRFRARHCRAPPLLGFFRSDSRYLPAVEPPNGVAVERIHSSNNIRVLACRHGRVLILLTYSSGELQVEVDDPLAGYGVVFPGPTSPVLDFGCVVHGSLICDHDDSRRGEDHRCSWRRFFQDVRGEDDGCSPRPCQVAVLLYGSGCIHASVSGDKHESWWRGLVSLSAPRDLFVSLKPGVLVRNAMYWLASPPHSKIVVFHLDTSKLHLIESLPVDSLGPYDYYRIVEAGDGELGMAAVRGSRLHLFALVTGSEGAARRWSEYRAVDLDTVRHLSPPVKAVEIIDEDANTVYLENTDGVFALHLKTMEINKVLPSGVALGTMIAYRRLCITGGSGRVRDNGENEVAAQQQMG